MADQANTTLTDVISTVIQVPGVKIDRNEFLCGQFAKETSIEQMQAILEKGPVDAGCDRALLRHKANLLIRDHTWASTAASFTLGLPGGLAMAATIPTDMAQFYGIALRLAQELAYLYGEPDLWKDGALDNERVMNQLVLYCGVMFGATGAAQTVRLLSSSLAKQALKQLPQKALTKAVVYRVVRSVAKAFGVKMTKGLFAKGVSKAIPIVGGIVSGGITLASMGPMGDRLADTLDAAHFDYQEEDFKNDLDVVLKEAEKEEADQETEVVDNSNVPEKAADQAAAEPIVQTSAPGEQPKTGTELLQALKDAKQLLDMGALNPEEFDALKKKLLERS